MVTRAMPVLVAREMAGGYPAYRHYKSAVINGIVQPYHSVLPVKTAFTRPAITRFPPAEPPISIPGRRGQAPLIWHNGIQAACGSHVGRKGLPAGTCGGRVRGATIWDIREGVAAWLARLPRLKAKMPLDAQQKRCSKHKNRRKSRSANRGTQKKKKRPVSWWW